MYKNTYTNWTYEVLMQYRKWQESLCIPLCYTVQLNMWKTGMS